MKRSDVNLCPFFRIYEYYSSKSEQKLKKYQIEGFCSIDDTISSIISISNKIPSKNEINNFRKRMYYKCSTRCPKLWDIEIMNDILDVDSFLSQKNDNDIPF